MKLYNVGSPNTHFRNSTSAPINTHIEDLKGSSKRRVSIEAIIVHEFEWNWIRG